MIVVGRCISIHVAAAPADRMERARQFHGAEAAWREFVEWMKRPDRKDFDKTA
jgi:hypothetical protein